MPDLYAKRYTLNAKGGFTLIELLVVISIIAILVAAATVSWTNAQQKARDGRRKSDLKSTQQALELYFQTYGTYPTTDGQGRIICNVNAAPKMISWGQSFDCQKLPGPSLTFINPLPKEPKGGTEYFYETPGAVAGVNVLKYQISALLENKKDPEYCSSGSAPPCSDPANYKLPCDPYAGYTYCVIQP